MAAALILDFQICEILLADGVWKDQTHHRAKCPQNRTCRCKYIAIFRIFKMAATAVFDFWIHDFLLAIGIQRVEIYEHAKFHQNWSIGCEDIKIFFQDSGHHHLRLSNSQKFIGWYDGVWMAHADASLYQISSKSAVPLRRYCFFRIFKMAAVRRLGFVWGHLDHPQWVFGDLYHSAKFGYDRCISCYNMNISIAYLARLAGKRLFTPPKLGFWGNLIS